MLIGRLHVHLDNNAEQGQIYRFTGSLMGHQYNETP
jgi:hypothetical protein